MDKRFGAHLPEDVLLKIFNYNPQDLLTYAALTKRWRILTLKYVNPVPQSVWKLFKILIRKNDADLLRAFCFRNSPNMHYAYTLPFLENRTEPPYIVPYSYIYNGAEYQFNTRVTTIPVNCGFVPVLYASHLGRWEIVKMLITEYNVRCNANDSCIIVHVLHAHRGDILRLLINVKPINFRTQGGLFLRLLTSSKKIPLEQIKHLYQKLNLNPFDAPPYRFPDLSSDFEKCPLFIATEKRKIDLVKYFLQEYFKKPAELPEDIHVARLKTQEMIYNGMVIFNIFTHICHNSDTAMFDIYIEYMKYFDEQSIFDIVLREGTLDMFKIVLTKFEENNYAIRYERAIVRGNQENVNYLIKDIKQKELNKILDMALNDAIDTNMAQNVPLIISKIKSFHNVQRLMSKFIHKLDKSDELVEAIMQTPRLKNAVNQELQKTTREDAIKRGLFVPGEVNPNNHHNRYIKDPDGGWILAEVFLSTGSNHHWTCFNVAHKKYNINGRYTCTHCVL
jgi:hypothetical protein